MITASESSIKHHTELFYDSPYREALDAAYNGNWFIAQQDIGQPRVETKGIVYPFFAYNLYEFEHGVLTAQGEYIVESGRFSKMIPHFTKPLNIEKQGGKVVYCGRIHEHYGHFLLESTARLWYYLENEKALQDTKLVFSMVSEDFPVPGFAREFFELLGIPQDKIHICYQPTQFDEVIIPPLSLRLIAQNNFPDSTAPRQFYTEKFLIPFRLASKKVKPAEHKKIYLSRRGWAQSPSIGEKAIETIYVDNGFTPIAMEELSLEGQIAVIKGAQTIAGINGTAMHNVLFSDQQPELIIMNRSGEPDAQYIINQALNLPCTLIRIHATPLPVKHDKGPFVVGCTKHLRQFFAQRGMEGPKTPFTPEKHYREFYQRWKKMWNDPISIQYHVLCNADTISVSELMKLKSYVKNTTFTRRVILWLKAHLYLGKARRKWKDERKRIRRSGIPDPKY